MSTLVTGAAGFVGFHVASRLLDAGEQVMGVDALRTDAHARLRAERLHRLTTRPGFTFERMDLARPGALSRAATTWRVERVVHLAAKTNVRDSVTEPFAYVHDNLTAFAEVLEYGRRRSIDHLVFASSGSVYGGGNGRPAAVGDATDCPGSFYAATKKANEMMAYSYAEAYRLPCTGLRLFNVYGPWARPDSAAMVFARAITRGQPVPVFGDGTMVRTFTYVGDVARAVSRALEDPPGAGQVTPFRIANVAGGAASTVAELLELLESMLGQRAQRRLLPMQPGEVRYSVGDCGGNPDSTPLAEGLALFLEWFAQYDALDNAAGRRQSRGRCVGA